MLPKEIQTLQTRLLQEDIALDDFFRFINTTYQDEEVKEIVKTVLDNIQLEIKQAKAVKNYAQLFINLKTLFEDYFCEKIEDERYLKSTDAFYDDGFVEEDETLIAFDLSLQEVGHPSTPELVRKNKRKKPESDPVILWFRRDLRIKDNPALNKAAKLNRPIIPVFLWSESEEIELSRGGARHFWLEQSLLGLKKSLHDKYGTNLILRSSSNLKKDLLALISETSTTDIVWTALYEPSIAQRDEKIKTALEDVGIKVHVEHSYLLHRPEQVSVAGVGLRGLGNVMHFMECCRVNPGDTIGMPVEPPKFILCPKKWPKSSTMSDLKLYVKSVRKDGTEVDWAKGLRSGWLFGEFGGFQYLRRFFDDNVEHYDRESSRCDQKWTSELSPYLHWGQLSPRTVLHEAFIANIAPKFRRKLAWRDLSYWLYTLFPDMDRTAIRPTYAHQWWSSNKTHLRAWQRGNTGYPLVDAAMRQIWKTGWTNNFMRHIVACFLVAYLRINWVEGLVWFSDTLIDFDVAISSMMWQNAGMSGLDQWNFVLHPVNSAVACDPYGKFVRKWIPEIKEIPTEFIHQPWACPKTELVKYKIHLGKDYPERIVTDLEKCRQGSIQDVIDARVNYGQRFIDPLNGRDRMEIPPKLLGEYISTHDQGLMIPLITRNEFIYKTLNPDATENPYDAVVTYDKNLVGAELPMMLRPAVPANLCCRICKELCMQAVRLNCCSSQACRACASKYVTKTFECWNCGKGNVTMKQLVNDDATRSAVREFRILPQKPKRATFSIKSSNLAPSFTQLSRSHTLNKLTRSKSTGALEKNDDDGEVTLGMDWRQNNKIKTPLKQNKDFSDDSDKSEESDEDLASSNSLSSSIHITRRLQIHPAKISVNKLKQNDSRSRSLSKGRAASADPNRPAATTRTQSKGQTQGRSRKDSIYECVSQPKNRRKSSEQDIEKPSNGADKNFSEGVTIKNVSRKNSIDKIKFNEVSVFYFNRTQGGVAVPREGHFTLGMENKHTEHKKWKIEDEVIKAGINSEHEYTEYDEQILFVPSKTRFKFKAAESTSMVSLDDDDDDEISFNFKPANFGTAHIPKEHESHDLNIPAERLETISKFLDNKEVNIDNYHLKQTDKHKKEFKKTNKSMTCSNLNLDGCSDHISKPPKNLGKAASESCLVPRKFNVSPVPLDEPAALQRGECGTRGMLPLKHKERASLLRDNGIVNIDKTEAEEIRLIRDSRRQCGCSCVDFCLSSTCECAINEIECQVENDGFPCKCSKKTCNNPCGRRTFDEMEVQLHYIQTMMNTNL